jgi:hypothetical protein
VFVPGSPPVDVMEFQGVVETRRNAEVGVRYWPVEGIDVAAILGYQWVDNADHVESEDRRDPYASVVLRLTR